MLSFLRGSSVPTRTKNAANNPIIYETGRSKLEFHPPGSPYLMTHSIPPTTAEHGVSIIQPPSHYHIHQTEHFHVRSGTGTFWKGISAEPWITLSADLSHAKFSVSAASTTETASETATTETSEKATTTIATTATIPPGIYHRFENASQTQYLILDVHLDPENYETEQRFFRNFLGYLDDCRNAGQAPSIFQLMVFLESADTPLASALPLPSERVGVWISWVVMVVLAFWGRAVLGYQDSYPEYFDGGKSR